ncbi:MAG: hypothetical protein ACI396_00940 [Acutalibacteraceae bacterium]
MLSTSVINNEKIAKSILNCISSLPKAKDGVYSVYTDVDLKHIVKKDGGKSMVPRRGHKGKLDIVVCDGNDVLLSLAKFCINYDMLELNFASGIDDVIDITLPKEKGLIYCSLIVKRELLNYESGSFMHFRREYEIPDAFVELDEFETNDSVNDKLQSMNIVSPNGLLTKYGIYSGVFFKYTLTENGIQKAVMIEPKKRDALFGDIFCENLSENGKLPLKTRLQYMNDALPSDNNAVENAVFELSQLLNAPLDEYFADYPEKRKRIDEDFARIAASMNRNEKYKWNYKPAQSYSDLLNAIVEIRNLIPYLEDSDEEIVFTIDCNRKALTDIAMPLLPQKSNMQCNRRNTTKYAIASLPLGYYFAAAARLTKSGYPMWLYRTRILNSSRRNEVQNCCRSLSTELGKCLSYYDDKFELFWVLYDLLITPLGEINNITRKQELKEGEIANKAKLLCCPQ